VTALNIVGAFEWHLFFKRVFHPDADFWRALKTTVYIAVAAQTLGVLLGLVSALGGMSRFTPLRVLSYFYVLVWRGTPVIVQIFFIYFGGSIFLGFDLFPRSINFYPFSLSGAVVAGIIALGLNEGSYMSEIIRAGINSIDRGQMESARSVGMTDGLAMRRIILPQAARVIVPPLGNEFNGMIKNTSLLAFIGVYELFFDAETHYSLTFQPVEYFSAVAVWYLLLTTLWTIVQVRIERKLSASERERRVGILSRMLGTPVPRGGR
jgi:polar amino acid transport system permease protein